MGLAGSGCTTLAAALNEAGLSAQELAIDSVTASDSPDIPQHCVVVVTASARDGISDILARAWEQLAELYVPRVLVWTFADVGRADDDDMRAIAERVLGEPTTAVALPLADDDEELAGVLDLRDWTIVDAQGRRAAETEHREAAASLRDELIDAVLTVTDDEAALNQRVSGMEPNPARLRTLVSHAIASGQFIASMTVKADSPRVGIEVLADLLRDVSAIQGRSTN